MKTIHTIYIVLLGTLFQFCDNDLSNPNENPCTGNIDPGIIAPVAYFNPIWHPNSTLIGFNHTPIKDIVYPNGSNCYGEIEFNYDSIGFWLTNADGTNMRRISAMTLSNPTWSPDGEWIAFVIGSDIYKIKFTGQSIDSSSLTKLTNGGRNYFPTWSPDGKWIAYDSDVSSPNGMNFVWKMRSDGSEKKVLAFTPSIGETRMPNWSSKGNQIVHIRYIGIDAPEIFTMDTTSGNVIRLTNNSTTEYYPQFNSEGNTIAYGFTPMNICLMDSIGNSIKQLTSNGVDALGNIPFSWNPKNSQIVFTSYRLRDWSRSNGVLWIIDINTGNMRQLTFN